MNKEKFIEELSKKTGYTEKDCITINDILENNFLIGKKNKDKIVNELKSKLSIDDQKANEVYEMSMEIIGGELKNKLIHPFKDLDK